MCIKLHPQTFRVFFSIHFLRKRLFGTNKVERSFTRISTEKFKRILLFRSYA